MTYQFRVLVAIEGGEPILRAEVAKALGVGDVWERFFEIRMGAGPTVRIQRTAGKDEVFDVEVTWGGALAARSRVRGQEAALDSADCLANALYEVRSLGQVADA